MNNPIIYRLLHKKDGTYVLQIELTNVYVDDNGNIKYEQYWHDLETAEEE